MDAGTERSEGGLLAALCIIRDGRCREAARVAERCGVSHVREA